MSDFTVANHLGIIKVLYLVALATGLFLVHDIRWITIIGLFQIALWLHADLGFMPIARSFLRVKWFFLIVIVSFLFIPPVDSVANIEIDLGFYTAGLHFSGLEHAAVMLSRVAILILASLWVRLSMPAGCFVVAIRQLGVPEAITIVIYSIPSNFTGIGPELTLKIGMVGSNS